MKQESATTGLTVSPVLWDLRLHTTQYNRTVIITANVFSLLTPEAIASVAIY